MVGRIRNAIVVGFVLVKLWLATQFKCYDTLQTRLETTRATEVIHIRFSF